MAKGLDRNLKVAGSSPSLGTLNFSVLVLSQCPDWVIKRTGGVYGFGHLKVHIIRKEQGIILGPGLISIIISSSSLQRRELTMAV